MSEIHNPKSRPDSPTAYEEPPGSCNWIPFKNGDLEGIRRKELSRSTNRPRPVILARTAPSSPQARTEPESGADFQLRDTQS
jgi:hypothetical protein